MAPPEPALLDTLHLPEQRRRLDPGGMLSLLMEFPEQCRRATRIVWQPQPGHDAPQIRNVVVTGMGGSAIGGDFLRSLMEQYGSVPVCVNRDYTLPQFVGPQTLVLAVSYSGSTEETLAAWTEAGERGAQRAVVTTGGDLRARAEAERVPVALVPGGQPPRSAAGYLFFPMLALLAGQGLLAHDFQPDLEETLEVLYGQTQTLGPEVPTSGNPAKQLASALYGRIPVLYGSQGYHGGATLRWKGQFNENAKTAAFANVLPEQNHNEISMWTQARRQADNWAVVFLRDDREELARPRIARRVEVTRDLLGPDVPVHEVRAEGRSLLARLFSLTLFADFTTVYLALLYGVCPTEIDAIDRLKTELARFDLHPRTA